MQRDEVHERAAVARERRQLTRLAGDLERLEVAREAHHAGRAERALERAARLRRDAQRQAIAVGDRDRLDGLTVGEAKQELLRAVARALARGAFQPRHLE